MNTDLLQKLANPVYEVEEAQELLKEAGREIVRLHEQVTHLQQYLHKLKDENERLALDLGLKDYPQLGVSQ